MRSSRVEGRRDRLTLAQDAGLSRLSFLSALSGTMVAYGASIVLLALVSGVVARARDRASTLGSYDWERIGVGAAVGLALILLVSYLFGGYVAGRMARRAGSLNGFLVFVLGVVVVGVAAAVIGTQTDQGQIVGGLRRAGIPTTGTEWSKIGSVAGIASLVAMLVGSVLGGILGERWHGKLLARALDPDIGPEADARRAEADARARREHVTTTRTHRVGGQGDTDERDVEEGDRRRTAAPARAEADDSDDSDDDEDDAAVASERGGRLPADNRRGGPAASRERPLRARPRR